MAVHLLGQAGPAATRQEWEFNMFDFNNGYKMIAVAAVTGALFSCNSNVVSQNNQQYDIITRLDSIDSRLTSIEGCGTQDYLDGLCDPGELPSDMAVTTTFCTEQGRGLELSASYGVQTNVEVELGAGWPSVGWVKGTDKLNVPGVIAIGPVPIVLPSDVSGTGAVNIGSGLEICVDLPIEPTDEQKLMIADLLEGVNVKQGLQAKYNRRTNRLLNFAALRTPLAAPTLPVLGTAKSNISFIEDTDDAFDIVDDAVERFMSDGFQPNGSAARIMGDPIFSDLASSLDLPQQVRNMITDPQHIFNNVQQVSLANSCAKLGFDGAARGRFPEINKLCNRIEGLPNDQLVRNVAAYVNSTRNRVGAMYTAAQTKNFICDNVSLSIASIFNCKGY